MSAARSSTQCALGGGSLGTWLLCRGFLTSLVLQRLVKGGLRSLNLLVLAVSGLLLGRRVFRNLFTGRLRAFFLG